MSTRFRVANVQFGILAVAVSRMLSVIRRINYWTGIRDYANSPECSARFGDRLGIPTLLKPATARLATTRQTDPAVGGHSIGWFTVPNGMLPRSDIFFKRTFGHTGFTGTLLLHDPECGVTVILLTNRVVNPADGTNIGRIRRLFANAIAGTMI